MHAEETPSRGRRLGLACLLAALAFALYWPTGSFEFVNLDDPEYVQRNPIVGQGLTLDGVAWAFGFHSANWHPLTWLSHMLDVELFGELPEPAGAYHLVNAALHALASALLFLALTGLSARLWPSLLVAALFAAHPVRVECVAWISERKELLAAVFFFALLAAYAAYARGAKGSLWLALLCFALGLMAKPVLVTAPFVLLLLDVWPLGRIGKQAWLEKWPFFALSVAASVATFLAQRGGGAVGELGALPFQERLGPAAAGVFEYLRVTFWPSGLAAFYPHPALSGASVTGTAVAGLLLVVVGSGCALLARRCCGAFFTGWFWFLGMLVPVIGLVQVGDQAWADRYAYLSTTGLLVALVFGAGEALRTRPALARVGAAVSLVAVLALAFVTTRTVPNWRDSKALFERAIAVTDKNFVAHNNLGLVYLERGDFEGAERHFHVANEILPTFVPALFNLALVDEQRGEYQSAVTRLLRLLDVRPGHPETLLKLAQLARASKDEAQAESFLQQAFDANPRDPLVLVALARFRLESGDLDSARNAAESAVRLEPAFAEGWLILGEVQLRKGELEEAARSLARAVELAPGSAEAQASHGRMLALSGKDAEARATFERSIQLQPDSARTRFDFGTLLLRQGEREAARGQFQAVNDLHPGDPEALTALAVMALEDGRSAEAIELLTRALERRPNFGLALTNLAFAYEKSGDWKRAVESYDRYFEGLEGLPDPAAACAMAWILATGPDAELLNGEQALEFATHAAQRGYEPALEAMAAAHARLGDFKQAVEVQKQAVQRARTRELKAEQEDRLRLYEAGQAYTRTP
jgi:tetratricopeptide (TPR) repeat protein